METRVIQTADAVIDLLGGTSATARLVGRSNQAVSNWRGTGRLPPETFLVISAALSERGASAPASLWGIAEPAPVRGAA